MRPGRASGNCADTTRHSCSGNGLARLATSADAATPAPPAITDGRRLPAPTRAGNRPRRAQ
ncbi:hypothetical protein NY98_09975 [Xanthomonas citri pv. fuscans]|uniref:Uncharacterized protein n=2 Tax=Xanthomonas TaxID=338 RepID=A0AB34Q7K2_XANCI|nr:hypothetical protein TP37_18160 [Xanthomonas citri pv. aurantifolii]AZU14560.1 hypothetical protein AC609_18110 [Xanthomonas phaseoli pv. phaseoli]AZU16218.1 hypothetical protein AC613_03690 [Xanthomonas citri pv. fuscans]AZU31659.1 hypothetical protein AC801_17815 [Xanthomonas sp. ISO98C4]AMV02304.1 hypothetical protein TP50_07525 [Xanthomonas citri pv. aurantifolii]